MCCEDKIKNKCSQKEHLLSILCSQLTNNTIVDIKKLREAKGLTLQKMADLTGIPKDRIARWEQRNSSPKTKDFLILQEFFGADDINTLKETDPNYKKTIKVTNANIGEIVGELFEKIIRIESHLEVYEQAIADIKSTTKADFMKTIGVMRKEVAEVSNRRFSELQMQYG